MTARFLSDEPLLALGVADAAAGKGMVDDEDIVELELVDEDVLLASVVLDEVGREDVELEVDEADVEVVLLEEVEVGE